MLGFLDLMETTPMIIRLSNVAWNPLSRLADSASHCFGACTPPFAVATDWPAD